MAIIDFANMRHASRVADAPIRVWRDWALLAAGLVGIGVELAVRTDIIWPPVAVAMAAVILATLMWRRTEPLLAVVVAYGVVVAINIASIIGDAAPIGLYTTVLVLVLDYALFRWGSGREAAIGLGFMSAAWLSSIISDYTGIGDAIGGLVVMLFPAALGLLVRYQIKSRQQDVEQARSLTREQLARELHDSVAHHVSAIALQAQGGRAMAASDPARAIEVLAVIEEEASRALDEMRNVVAALRGGETADGPELRPQPGIANINELADISVSAPLVEIKLEGDLSGLKPATDATLYRLTQEAITNAVRHARDASRVLVRIVGDDNSVKLTVRDDGIHNPAPIRSSGFGLIGMTERARLLGGTMDAGPNTEGRGWVVTAVLPRTGQLQ